MSNEIVKNDELISGDDIDSTEQKNNNNAKLLSRNFILIWQGALISETGNNIQKVVMAFWLLKTTGSTVIMAALTAIAMLVHSFVSLFSGAVIDKTNKRNVLVITDFFQGVICILMGLAVMFNVIEIWMIIVLGVFSGICCAFFYPASQSMIPEIVPANKLMKANAFMLFIGVVTPIIGNGLGGYFFQTIGAPVIFIGNGITYFMSSFSELFIKLPKSPDSKKMNPINDIKEGYIYLMQHKGLRFFMAVALILNLFTFTGLFLILPYFDSIPTLGATSFGIAMACMAAGGLIGMLISLAITIKPEQRFPVYALCLIGMTVLPAAIPYFPFLPVLCALGFFAGLMRTFVFLIFRFVVQNNVEADKMGRIFGLMGIIVNTTTPLGMIIGGALAEFLPLNILITGSFLIAGILIIPILIYKPLRKMFIFDKNAN